MLTLGLSEWVFPDLAVLVEGSRTLLSVRSIMQAPPDSVGIGDPIWKRKLSTTWITNLNVT